MLSFTDPAVTTAEADDYASVRRWLDWMQASDSEKSSAILRAQTFVAATYNSRWLSAWKNEEAPENVRFAIVEAARRELQKPGSLAPDYDPSKVITNKKVKAGPVETQTAYADPKASRASVPMVEYLLAGLLGGLGGTNFRVSRA